MSLEKKQIDKNKLKASTLTEVLVALTIITLISALFFAIIIKAGNYHRNRRNIIIHRQILEIIQETQKNGYTEDEVFDYDGYFIAKRLQPYKNINAVYEIEVTAYQDDETKIMEHKAIIEKYINNWNYLP